MLFAMDEDILMPHASGHKIIGGGGSDCSTCAVTDREHVLSEDYTFESLSTMPMKDLLIPTMGLPCMTSPTQAAVVRDIFRSLNPSHVLGIRGTAETTTFLTADRLEAAPPDDCDQFKVFRSSLSTPSKSAFVNECMAPGQPVDIVLLAAEVGLEVDFDLLWKAEGLLSEDAIVCIDLGFCGEQEGFAAAFTSMIEASPDMVCFKEADMLVVQRSNFPGTFAA